MKPSRNNSCGAQARKQMNIRVQKWQIILAIVMSSTKVCLSFTSPHHIISSSSSSSTQLSSHWANRLDSRFDEPPTYEAVSLPKVKPLTEQFTRRSLLTLGIGATATLLSSPLVANAAFAPGGTLLDREVGPLVGNPEASPSRRNDNSNVLFTQDNYFKFGAAAQWIPAGSTEFPKTMPFVLSQQRYDALKKYGSRVDKARDTIVQIGSISSADDVANSDDPIYQLRALGLLANSFLASENTGTTNELMLARWYINELYLRIGDYRVAIEKGDAEDAKISSTCLNKAMNSYLTLLNRSITSKVGDPFGYIE